MGRGRLAERLGGRKIKARVDDYEGSFTTKISKNTKMGILQEADLTAKGRRARRLRPFDGAYGRRRYKAVWNTDQHLSALIGERGGDDDNEDSYEAK
jgi:hypothetical protein